MGKCLKQLAAFISGDLLPMGDDRLKHRTRFQQTSLVMLTHRKVRQFYGEPLNFALIGFIAGFQILDDAGIGDRLQVVENGLFAAFGTADFLLNPPLLTVTAVFRRLQCLLPDRFVNRRRF